MIRIHIPGPGVAEGGCFQGPGECGCVWNVANPHAPMGDSV